MHWIAAMCLTNYIFVLMCSWRGVPDEVASACRFPWQAHTYRVGGWELAYFGLDGTCLLKLRRHCHKGYSPVAVPGKEAAVGGWMLKWGFVISVATENLWMTCVQFLKVNAQYEVYSWDEQLKVKIYLNVIKTFLCDNKKKQSPWNKTR